MNKQHLQSLLSRIETAEILISSFFQVFNINATFKVELFDQETNKMRIMLPYLQPEHRERLQNMFKNLNNVSVAFFNERIDDTIYLYVMYKD